MRINSPCKDCSNRRELCHSTCKDYIAYKDKIAELKAIAYQEIIADRYAIRLTKTLKKTRR